MAEAATNSDYKCLLCSKQYNQPRKLSCHHTLCYSCLAEYVIEHVTSEDDRYYFPCPVCDAPITPRDASLSVSKWASSFPTNHCFISPTALTFDDKVCDACLRENESNPAEVWCSECPDFLCKQCRIAHKKNRKTATHRLVAPGDAENIQKIYDLSSSTVCPYHDEKSLDAYCLDHHAMCCSVCVCLQHRSCSNVKSMKDVATKTMTDQQINRSEWEKISEMLDKMVAENELEIDSFTATEKKISDDMTQLVQLAKDKLDELREIFQSDVCHNFSVCRKQLSDRQRYITAFRTNLNNSKLLMSNLEKHCDHQMTFITREHTKQQLSSHYRRMARYMKDLPNTFTTTLSKAYIIDEIMRCVSIGNVSFSPKISTASEEMKECISSMLENILPTPRAVSFADSVLSSDIEGCPQHVSVGSIPCKTIDVWKESASLVQTVTSEVLSAESPTCLTGGIYTDNGELIVTDFYNQRLLLLDDNYACLEKYMVGGNPSDIARGSTDGDIFVAVNDNRILRCTLGIGQLTVVSTIKSPPQTWGISVNGDNIVCGTDRSVDILSMDGTILRSVKKKGSYTYIAMSKNLVYHKNGDCLVSTRLDDGTEISRYRDPCLTDPRGVGLDQHGNVYACGLDGGHVYLVSPDMSCGKEILPKLTEITKPYSIVVHPSKPEFVVTSLREPVSLEVYRFIDSSHT
ncbi:uncharacterized protein [Argopecten irradians]|uniref:uncharacterized protein n=1 Tax=Argopecten irradians TaxID=31199 RepID=UPI003717A493